LIRALFFDDACHGLRCHRLDIGVIGHLRIGHDRGRIAVDEHHLVPFFLEGLAGLGTGVVEFAGLADDDGPGANQKNFMDISAFGHERLSVIVRFAW